MVKILNNLGVKKGWLISVCVQIKTWCIRQGIFIKREGYFDDMTKFITPKCHIRLWPFPSKKVKKKNKFEKDWWVDFLFQSLLEILFDNSIFFIRTVKLFLT